MTTAASSTQPVRVRIAPSPTGDPHVGTAYIGLLNFIFARQRGGKFLLRVEDTDRARFVESSEKMIFDSLHWLGLEWDEGPDIGGPHGPYRQSERTEIYRNHCDELLKSGAAYRCFCTTDELETRRKQQIAAKLPARYDRTCRALSADEVNAKIAAGTPFTVRMAVPVIGSTTFRDELRGEITFDHNNVDDQVLLKSDGFPTYHLANVVDDHLMQISDVIRAEEWISSTPKHVLLYASFGWQLPRFWHMPLLRNTDKSKISKRKNPVSVIYYRQAGFLPQAMTNFLGLMGGGMKIVAIEPSPSDPYLSSEEMKEFEKTEIRTSSKDEDIFTLKEMEERFDFTRISLGGPVFDLVKLKWLNGEYLRALTPEEYFLQLRNNVFADDLLRQLVPLLQTRIETLSQFGDLADFFFKDDVMPTEDVYLPKSKTREETLAFCAELLTALEPVQWTTAEIDPALRALGDAKGWSVKENFMLLRAIITGKTASPPLLESMVVFGKARSLDRIRRFLDAQKKSK
jgi:glutamyl-tRNA synthetase